MIKIGITGQIGFIGTHIFNAIGLYANSFERIQFSDGYFADKIKLQKFASMCDVIVHLAAMNRHSNTQIIYETNIRLVKQLIEACEETQSTPHILFASSTQEDLNNDYGKSKKEGRVLLEKWANKNSARFTALIIPNVYGPFGHPFYNSAIATFCHQLTHDEKPVIDIDGELNLIYVSELANNIIEIIRNTAKRSGTSKLIQKVIIKHTERIRVSEVLQLLEYYKTSYFDNKEIPKLDTPLQRNLFNTFVCYIDHAIYFPCKLNVNRDSRGLFSELIKFNNGGQISFSTTFPGITRGNHYHTRKTERFAVIKGKARIDIRRIGFDKVLSFQLDGDNQPSFVDIPIWHTHNITNIGKHEVYTIFWTNEHFNPDDADTFFVKV